MTTLILQQFKNNRDFIKRIFIYIFLFGLIAHSTAFFNTFYEFDSLSALSTEFASGQVSWKYMIGRFAHPIYHYMRGYLAAPWLLGGLALAWLAISTCLLLKTFKIRSEWIYIAVCALLVTHSSLTITYASCSHESDSFMLAFLFSIASVFVFVHYKRGYLIAPLLLFVSLIFYQAYFAVATSCFLVVLIKNILDDNPLPMIFRQIAKILFILVTANAIHQLGAILFYSLTNYNANLDLPNSFSVINVTIFSFGASIINTYTNYFQCLASPITHHYKIVGLIQVLLCTYGFFLCLLIVQKRGLSRVKKILLLGLLLLLPFSINLLCFIRCVPSHDTMIHVHAFSLIFFYMLIEKSRQYISSTIYTYSIRLSIVACAVIISSNCIYSNQLYLGKQLVHTRDLADITRVIYTIENTDGYVINETPVIIYGNLTSGSMQIPRPGFQHLRGFGGDLKSGDRLNITTKALLTSYLAYPINLINHTDKDIETIKDEIDSMPIFPSKGYCKIIDGKLVVKLSDKHIHLW